MIMKKFNLKKLLLENCIDENENYTVVWKEKDDNKIVKKYYNCGCCDDCSCDDNISCKSCNCGCNRESFDDDCDYDDEEDDNVNDIDYNDIDFNDDNTNIEIIENKVRISFNFNIKLNENTEKIKLNIDISNSTWLKIAEEILKI